MRFDILTIFPEAFESYFNTSIIKRAQAKKLLKINIFNLRKWTKDKHQTVDDRPYGGGAGMIFTLEPIFKALKDLKKHQKEDWTNITLRHKLRETVAKLIYEYKKTDEYKTLMNVDLSGASSIEAVLDIVDQQQELIDAQGNHVEPEIILDNIKEGRLHLLPEPIRFKVIEINRRNNEQEMIDNEKNKSTSKSGSSLFGRLGRALSQLKFWGK